MSESFRFVFECNKRWYLLIIPDCRDILHFIELCFGEYLVAAEGIFGHYCAYY
jgi:hypothetical protein